jgi:hypothetical protein
MTRHAGLMSMLLAVACAGCDPSLSSWLAPDSKLGTVPDQPLAAASPELLRTVANSPPATVASTQRVNTVAQRLLAANSDLRIRPLFLGIGVSDVEIFHRDTSAIYVSDGLVNKCTTDAQLAAVLANELGKMVATREAVLALKALRSDREPPVTMPIGSDSRGSFGPADGTTLAELGKYQERTGCGPSGVPAAPPNPEVLARSYLKKAGFEATDLDAVAPLLREAAQHCDIETQFNSTPGLAGGR